MQNLRSILSGFSFLKRGITASLMFFLFFSLLSCEFFSSREREMREESSFYNEAVTAIGRGEIGKAKSIIKNFGEIYPQNLKLFEVKFILSRKLYQNGMYDEALLYLNQIPGDKLPPAQRVSYFETLGRIYLIRGEIYRGINELLNALSYATSKSEVKRLKGTIKDTINNKAAAGDLERIINSYANKFPADEALLKLSKLKLEAGNELESMELLEKFLSLFPSNPRYSEAKKFLGNLKEGMKYNKNLIGVIVPFSGKFSAFGEWVRNGIMTAVNQNGGKVFGRPIELIFKDSEGSPDKSEKALEELAVKHKAIAVVGPIRSPSVKACVKAADKYKIPVVSPTADEEDIVNLSPYIFRNTITPKMQAEAMASYSVNKMGLKKFAIIYPENFYGKNLQKYFSVKVKKLGGTIIAEESYNPEETDFQEQAIRIKERQEALSPIDGIYLPGVFDKVALIIPHLFFQGVQGAKLLGSNGWDSNMGGSEATPKKLLELVEDKSYLEGAVFTDGFYADSNRPEVQEFVKDYKDSFDSIPNFYSAQSYDAASILINLLRSGAITRGAIREGLVSVKNYKGVSGITTILPSGDSEKKLFFIKITNGDFEEINQE